MTPEEIETIRWGGNGSGILSPSSKGECSGYYKGETMTTEEIKKLTDADLMLKHAAIQRAIHTGDVKDLRRAMDRVNQSHRDGVKGRDARKGVK